MQSAIDLNQLWLLSPQLSVALLGMLVLAVDLLGRRRRLTWLVALVGLAIPAALTASLVFQWFGPITLPATAFFGTLVVDRFTLFFLVLFLVVGLGVILVSYEYAEKYLRATPGEFYSIILFSLAGMMLMAASGELITLYISYELMSFPLYILAGLMRNDTRSQEAGLKYILLGAMSSAILLYGMALIYGATGTTALPEIASATANVLKSGNLLLLVGEIFVFTGLGFKVSAVPFHMWAPDIYEGSPTPSTLFFSIGSKAAGFAALLRIFAFGGLASIDGSILWVIVAVVAALTMTLGNVVALLQTNIKRMMAYSSIGQAGYILVGFAALLKGVSDAGAVGMLTFIFVYVVTSIGVFAGIIALGDATGRESVRDFDGFGRRAPWLAAGMSLCLLALAGIPPMAGFLSKLFIFIAAWHEGGFMTFLVVLGLINSAISLVYYANVTWRMYSVEPEKRNGIQAPRAVKLTMALAVFGVFALTVAFGYLAQAGVTNIVPVVAK
jgi:NADH-quinone oxidoreductase subunit N